MALREINLIPGEILNRRYFLRHLCLWIGGMVISLTMIFCFYFYQVHLVLAKERSVTTLEDMRMNLNTRVMEVKQVQEELERLVQQQTVLETITRNQSYSNVLLTLAAVMGEETWLRKLIIDSDNDDDKGKQDGTTLVLNGFSYTNEGLGDFISKISNEDMSREVALKYAKETYIDLSREVDEEKIKLVEFQIDCKI